MSFPVCLSTSAWNFVPSARSRITRSSSAFMKNLLNFFISSFRVFTKARCSAVSVMSSFFPLVALFVSAARQTLRRVFLRRALLGDVLQAFLQGFVAQELRKEKKRDEPVVFG
jgi:hypothetical protein